jgi:general secretion pathway protein F
MRFKLTVIQGHTPPETLRVHATNKQQAIEQAKAQGWTVVHAQGSWLEPYRLSVTTPRLRRPPPGQVAIQLEQLLTLLYAGLSVIEALDTLGKDADDGWAESRTRLVAALRQGNALSAALEADGGYPDLLIALIRSAEMTSDLPNALKRFLEHDRRAAQVRHQLKSVALYPSLLLLVGGAVMLFLLLYVIPRFARIFETMAELPWSARLMLQWSRLLNHHGQEMALGAGALLGLLVYAAASPDVRARMLAPLLRFKPIGKQFRLYHLARWYRTTGMLLQGGIPFTQAWGMANNLLPPALRQGGAQVEHMVRQGASPSDAYQQAGVTTAVATRLIRAGEQGGELGTMLDRAAEFHEAQVLRTLDQGMRILEPVVMALIGVGIGLVVIMMYMPIFELASAIQ